MNGPDKPLNWMHGEVHPPPFSEAARRERGALLRQLQRGESLGMPHSRPMPSIGPRCHELRVSDEDRNWRLIYRVDIDPGLIHVVEVFDKTTRRTPPHVIANGRRRLAGFDAALAAARAAGKSKGGGKKGG